MMYRVRYGCNVRCTSHEVKGGTQRLVGHGPVVLPSFAYRASDRDTSKAMTTPSLLGLGDVDRRHVFHPFSVLSEHESSGPRRMIVEGRGSTLTDDQGKTYLDAMAGLWCVNVGYGRPEIAEALKSQALKLPYYHAFSSMA